MPRDTRSIGEIHASQMDEINFREAQQLLAKEVINSQKLGEVAEVAMTKPITPDELKVPLKPDEVIRAVNELIQKYWNGSEACFKQAEAAELIAERMGISQKVVFDNHYLDIEGLYRQSGWNVVYDKPDYNEAISYLPTFTFSRLP